MAKMTWNPNDMRSKASQLEQYSQEYDSIRNQLRQVATSMGSAYISQDNQTYVAHIEQFCTELQNMSDKLRTAASTLQSQAAAYDAQEMANTQQASLL